MNNFDTELFSDVVKKFYNDNNVQDICVDDLSNIVEIYEYEYNRREKIKNIEKILKEL